MKKALIIFALFAIICFCLYSKSSRKRPEFLGADDSIAELSYRRSGGELGESYEIALDAAGSMLIVTEQETAGSDEMRSEYPVDADALKAAVAEYAEKYGLAVWKHKKSGLEVLDGETVTIRIASVRGFDFILSSDEEIPNGKETVFEDFCTLLLSFCNQ